MQNSNFTEHVFVAVLGKLVFDVIGVELPYSMLKNWFFKKYWQNSLETAEKEVTVILNQLFYKCFHMEFYQILIFKEFLKTKRGIIFQKGCFLYYMKFQISWKVLQFHSKFLESFYKLIFYMYPIIRMP